MTEGPAQGFTPATIDVIVWAREVEVRGLPVALQKEFEKRGAFWSTRGLRMTDKLFLQLEQDHPEFHYVKRELSPPCEHEHHVPIQN